MTIRELKDKIEALPDDMAVVFFDDNEGEYMDIKAYPETISYDSSWARYTGEVLVIEIRA